MGRGGGGGGGVSGAWSLCVHAYNRTFTQTWLRACTEDPFGILARTVKIVVTILTDFNLASSDKLNG